MSDWTIAGRWTVLVVEGNQKIRGDIHRALESRGFRVISAWDAQDVLGFLATHDDAINVAVVDTTMLGADRALLSILREKRPGIRIVLTDDPGTHSRELGFDVIERPFEVADVVDRLLPLTRQAVEPII